MNRLASFALAGLLVACNASATSSAGKEGADVTIEHFQFFPATLEIAVGASVTWTNKDDDVHTVMDAAGVFRSGALDGGQSYSYTFAKAGVYRIACSLHPQMSETIIVE